jgi:hypothetical protein
MSWDESENADSTLLRNIGFYQPDYTAPQLKRTSSEERICFDSFNVRHSLPDVI